MLSGISNSTETFGACLEFKLDEVGITEALGDRMGMGASVGDFGVSNGATGSGFKLGGNGAIAGVLGTVGWRSAVTTGFGKPGIGIASSGFGAGASGSEAPAGRIGLSTGAKSLAFGATGAAGFGAAAVGVAATTTGGELAGFGVIVPG